MRASDTTSDDLHSSRNRKRSLDDIACSFEGCYATKENVLKKHLNQPSYVSIIKANLQQKQKQKQRVVMVDSAISKPEEINSSSSNDADESLLEETFQPGNWHVIYGREKSHKEHIGNKRLRVLIANNLKAYVEAPTRRQKSKIIDDVVSQIRCYGGFIKKSDGGRWLSIGPVQSREKVGHSFRDCMKLFKGKKPESKQTQWTEAQNAIFNNLNLRAPSPPKASSLSRSLSPIPRPVSPTPPRVVSAGPLHEVSQQASPEPEQQRFVEDIACDFPVLSAADVEPLPLL